MTDYICLFTTGKVIFKLGVFVFTSSPRSRAEILTHVGIRLEGESFGGFVSFR